MAIGACSAILTGLLPVACKGGHGSSSMPSAFDAEADGAYGDGEPGDGAAATSFLRLANWAPDAVFNVDVCVTTDADTDAGTWIGPLLGTGVTFPNVGGYVEVPAGVQGVSVVVAGKGCGALLAPMAQLPSLGAGGYATVALLGDIVPSGTDPHKPGVYAFADDAVGIQGQAAVRFVNAMPSGSPVVFGTGTVASATFSPLTAALPAGSASIMPASGVAADANGYLLLSPQSTVTVSADDPNSQTGPMIGSVPIPFDAGVVIPSGTGFGGLGSDVATGTNAAWPGGSVVTIALIDGEFGVTPELLFCLDGALAQASMAMCTVLSH